MIVEDDGSRLSLASEISEVSKVTVDFMDQLLEHYRDQKLLHRKYAFQILLDARTYFMAQPTLVHITVSQIFVQKFNFDKTPTFSRVFHQKFFLTIFFVKSEKLSTAKKSKTTTFSRIFHPKS